MDRVDTKTTLSALWLFNLLNIIFRDIRQVAMKSEREMPRGGRLDQIPIGSVLFSLPLTCRIGRPEIIVAVQVTGGKTLSSAPSDLDNVLHLAIELVAMVAILWTAWTWPDGNHATARFTG
ncbi:MAG: hypothetical protein QNJ44_20635 [Rhodobacter sp.]|nr:hypothetical protein [Rhodobacter sp.]